MITVVLVVAMIVSMFVVLFFLFVTAIIVQSMLCPVQATNSLYRTEVHGETRARPEWLDQAIYASLPSVRGSARQSANQGFTSSFGLQAFKHPEWALDGRALGFNHPFVKHPCHTEGLRSFNIAEMAGFELHTVTSLQYAAPHQSHRGTCSPGAAMTGAWPVPFMYV